MKFTYNVGDKLVAKKIGTVANFFNHYVPAGSVVTLLENISNRNGYELIKIKTPDGTHFATSAEYFDPYIKKEENSLKEDNVIDNLAKFMVDNLDEKDLDEFIAAIAMVIKKAYPNFLDNKNKEKCCDGEDCNCSEECDCLCENCDCGNDKEIEETVSEVEPYSGKIYCVKSGYDYITEGKIYEVEEGKIEADDGWVIRFSPEKGCTGVLSTFEEFSEVIRGEWLEVKEAEEIISPSNYEADIICVYSGPIENFTKGKIYRVENGYLYDDKRNKISWYGVPFIDINGINSYCASIFKEIKH